MLRACDYVMPDLVRHPCMKNFYVYILASKMRGTLYVGVTNDLRRRVYEHKNNLAKGFTKEHNIHLLVFFEVTSDVVSAIAREKKLKNWLRQWKIELTEKTNPNWNDLYEEL